MALLVDSCHKDEKTKRAHVKMCLKLIHWKYFISLIKFITETVYLNKLSHGD